MPVQTGFVPDDGDVLVVFREASGEAGEKPADADAD
jgi:hypothetical protein